MKGLMKFTSQFVVSVNEAYVASTEKREPRGPNGETNIASILHTENAGESWKEISWARSLWSKMRYPAFPTWPPESVLSLTVENGSLVVTHRDEWVPFEPGGESLWKSRFNGKRWSVMRLRRMNYESKDSPAPDSGVALALPQSIAPPNQAFKRTGHKQPWPAA